MKRSSEESNIRPFIHRKILVLKSTTSIQTAARAMCERRVGSAVVTDADGHVVGFVTDRDITCRATAFGVTNETHVSEIMSIDVQTVEESADLSEVIQLMIDGGIRRVPIVRNVHGGKHKCTGLVAFDDLVASGAASLNDLKKIITAQIRKATYSLPSQERSDERKEQTYNRFIAKMAKVLDVNKDHAESFTLHMLKTTVKRLPATGAAHFICQLPSIMQEDLFSLPAGPDRAITAQTFLNEARKAAHTKTEKAAALYLIKFWKGLEAILGDDTLDHVLIQMPEDIRRIVGRPDVKTQAPSPPELAFSPLGV